MESSTKKDYIIITFSQQMIKEKGGLLAFWRDFMKVMNSPDHVWCQGTGNKPTVDVDWCYIVIGGKIVGKAFIYAMEKGGEKEFTDGSAMVKKAWISLQGPLVRPGKKYYRKGFQGFRYTEFIF
jgi:hypothetical protein